MFLVAAVLSFVILGFFVLLGGFLLMRYHKVVVPFIISLAGAAGLMVPYFWGVSDWVGPTVTKAMHFAMGWFYSLVNSLWSLVAPMITEFGVLDGSGRFGGAMMASTGNSLSFGQIYFTLLLMAIPLTLIFTACSDFLSERRLRRNGVVSIWADSSGSLGGSGGGGVSPIQKTFERNASAFKCWVTLGVFVFVYALGVGILSQLF